MKTLAPNINLAANIGSQADPTHFPTLFANVGGGLTEDLYSWSPAPTAFTRNEWYTGIFQYFPWLGSAGRLAATRAELPAGDTNAFAGFVCGLLADQGPQLFLRTRIYQRQRESGSHHLAGDASATGVSLVWDHRIGGHHGWQRVPAALASI